MKKATIAIRILMGLIFLVFGLNGFFRFLPMPPMEGQAGEFIALLMASKLLYAVKFIEIASSVLLLSGRYVSLGLLLLAPIIFNIFWFHVMLAPEGAPMGVALLAMEGFMLWNHKKAYAPLLKQKS